MTTNTMNTTIATAEAAAKKDPFIARLKETLSCWTTTRADLVRMQRETAREYKAAHNI